MIVWLIIIFLILLSIYASSWFWIPTILLGFWKAGQIYFYKGRPWRRIHFPMMRIYSRVAGMETAISDKENREFDINRALFHLLKTTKPLWDDSFIEQYINECGERCEKFTDKKNIIEYLYKKNPSVNKEKINSLIEGKSDLFKNSDYGITIRMVIAGIIEIEYGEEHRTEYLVEVLDGRAS